MNREGHEEVIYFIGPEVEKTPAADKRTLFVVGKQDVAQIERMAREYRTPHIFMGANHSFGYENPGDNTYWDNTITALLDKGFWVTLDYQAHLHDAVLKMLNPGIWQSRLFVPMLSVRIPNLQTSSNNLTIKFDDVDFEATNEGVWCLHHHQVTDSNRFTPWQDYKTDTVLSPMFGPVPNPVLTIPVPQPQVSTVVKSMTKPVNLEDLIDGEVRQMGQLGGGDSFLGSLAAREREALKDPDVLAGFNEAKNNSELGLDVAPTTALKPDDTAETIKALDIIDAAAAADAYAEGAKDDPLSKEASKKPVKAKK